MPLVQLMLLCAVSSHVGLVLCVLISANLYDDFDFCVCVFMYAHISVLFVSK